MGSDRAELERLRAALDAAGDLAYEWDLATDAMSWSGRTGVTLGVADTTRVGSGTDFQNRINPQDLAPRLKALSDHLTGGQPFECEYRLRSDSGDSCWVNERGGAQLSAAGRPMRLHGTMRVVTERKEHEAHLEYLANHDELTGHYNRSRLRDSLDHALAYAKRYGAQGVFMSIGIDKLTRITEAFGYETTDAIIVAVGQRLERCLRESDVIARIGDDRFGVVMHNCPPDQTERVAEKILDAVSQKPVVTPTGARRATISIGGIGVPDCAQTGHDAMAKADVALRDARADGGNTFVLFHMSAEEQRAHQHNVVLAETVQSALKEGRLQLAYQPIVEAKTGAVRHYECLVRLTNEKNELINAAEFVPVVEQLGLIRIVDKRVLEMAVVELERHPSVVLAVNISAMTANDKSWLRTLSSLVKLRPELANRLVVEITETAALQELDESARFVSTLRDLGCGVALDDFGAGYSSFRHLKALPVNMVKIDGSFVYGVADNVGNQLFIRALVELAKGFNLVTVAEGVETAADAEILVGEGVSCLQGYYFARPSMERPWLAPARRAS